MRVIKNVVIRGYNHPITYHEKLTKGDMHDYKYSKGESPEDVICGACNSNTLEIKISQHTSEDMQEITRWHEIFHMLLVHSSIPIFQHDERLIDILAYGIVEVIRDNPELIKLTQERETPR